jgi:hypothetical protein
VVQDFGQDVSKVRLTIISKARSKELEKTAKTLEISALLFSPKFCASKKNEFGMTASYFVQADVEINFS